MKKKHAGSRRTEGERLVKWYRDLLKECTGHTREEVAEAFVRSGTTFCKGPFRMANFTRAEQRALPTNTELMDCAIRLGAVLGRRTVVPDDDAF